MHLDGNAQVPEKLYKFIGLNSEYGIANVKNLLCKNKIRVSRFSSLNDPFEGTILKNSDQSFRSFASQLEQSETGVFSLSSSNSDLLMWSHYATSHRGLCFEFDIFKDDWLKKARKIDYVATFPCFDSQDPFKGLYIKSADWEYEKEFRVLYPSISNRAVKINPLSLSAVYFGYKCELSDITEIFPIAKNRNVKCFQAERVRHDFKLEFKEVNEIKDFDQIIKLAALDRIIANSLKKTMIRSILEKIRKFI